MKIHLKLLALVLMLIMLVQSTVFSAFAVVPSQGTSGATSSGYTIQTSTINYSSDYNSGKRNQIATTLEGTSADAYYTGSNEYDVLSEKSADAIKTALSSLMKSTHTYTSSYDDCHYKADRTDCENGNGKVSLIYTGYSATMSQWNGWNREHVWPKSLGGNNTSGGGADMHHIRPSDAGVNSSRGNKKYGEVSGGTAKYGSNPATGVLGGYYSSTYFEPLDNVKGDVARIVLYVWVRWGSAWGADNVTEVFQSVDVLLEWCELDPVDTWELGRNEVIEDIQGNRNVFIDYPEYAWLIFGREVPEDMYTPSGEAQTNAHHWDSGSVTTAATCTTSGIITYKCTDTGCGETKTETVSALGHSYNSGVITTNPTCTDKGVKTLTCSRCQATRTESITALGHSYGEWIIEVPATETTTGSQYKICSTCGNKVTEIIPIIGHEHNYTETVTPPTCNSEGYTTHTCSCGHSYVDSYKDLLYHDYQNGSCVFCGEPDPTLPSYTKDDFTRLVSNITNGAYTGQNMFVKLCDGIRVYNSLSSADKEAVSEQYNTLINLISQYNNEITSVNNDTKKLSSSLSTVIIMISASTVTFATYTLLNKKYF